MIVYNLCWGVKYAEILEIPAIMNNFQNHDFASLSLTFNKFIYSFQHKTLGIKSYILHLFCVLYLADVDKLM